MNINDLDAVPSFDADLNAKKIGDCGTCNSDIYDNYTKCTKCDALICEDCKEEDWCRSCEEDHEKLKDENDSKVCTWCSENTDTLQQLKIKWIYYILIRIGLKTLELRAYESLKDGGKFLLTTPKGRTLGIIELQLWLIYCKEEACFMSEMEHKNNHLQNTWFWRPWIKYYLNKGKTPAFYKIVNFEAKK